MLIPSLDYRKQSVYSILLNVALFDMHYKFAALHRHCFFLWWERFPAACGKAAGEGVGNFAGGGDFAFGGILAISLSSSSSSSLSSSPLCLLGLVALPSPLLSSSFPSIFLSNFSAYSVEINSCTP